MSWKIFPLDFLEQFRVIWILKRLQKCFLAGNFAVYVLVFSIQPMGMHLLQPANENTVLYSVHLLQLANGNTVHWLQLAKGNAFTPIKGMHLQYSSNRNAFIKASQWEHIYSSQPMGIHLLQPANENAELKVPLPFK